MGSSNKAAREAEASEAARRAQVAAAQQQIESIYTAPGRETDINDLIAATKQFLTRDLTEKNVNAKRDLKFALARGGQSGGSVDVDEHGELGKLFLKGALEAERRSQQAGNSLRQADQSSKLNLFSMAQQGLDMTTAARQAGEAMRSNIAGAKSDAFQTGIGDLFGQMGDIYKRSRERAGERKAERYQYGTFYAPSGPGGW